jgi:Cu(I)/Ag(I) efflux system periplasmic protein CusF
MNRKITTALLIAGFASAPVFAQQAQDHAAHHPAAAVEATSSLTDGEVRRIDKETKKITLRHGAIANLDMPPMTMVFQVADAAMLDHVKVGDKVRFAVEKREGAFTVTRIDSAS